MFQKEHLCTEAQALLAMRGCLKGAGGSGSKGLAARIAERRDNAAVPAKLAAGRGFGRLHKINRTIWKYLPLTREVAMQRWGRRCWAQLCQEGREQPQGCTEPGRDGAGRDMACRAGAGTATEARSPRFPLDASPPALGWLPPALERWGWQWEPPLQCCTPSLSHTRGVPSQLGSGAGTMYCPKGP